MTTKRNAVILTEGKDLYEMYTNNIPNPSPYLDLMTMNSDTNLNLTSNHMRASFPPCRCFTAVNDALASPSSVQLKQNEKSTPHMIIFRLRLV